MRRAVVLLFFGAIGSGAAAGHDVRCDAPPFGATPEAYWVVSSEPGLLAHLNLDDELRAICRMKYDGATRAKLHSFGFTDPFIDASSPVMLLLEYTGALIAAGKGDQPPSLAH